MPSGLKILYVVPALPCPPQMGHDLRSLHIGRLLKGCGEVTLVSLEFSDVIDPQRLSETTREFGKVHVFKIRKRKHKNYWLKFQKLLDIRLNPPPSLVVSEQDREQFEKLRQAHDLVWFRGANACSGFGKWKYPRSVLDIDDFEHAKKALQTEIIGSIKTRLLAKFAAWKLKRRERAFVDRFTILCVCSDNDKKQLPGGDRIHIVPNGFESPEVYPEWNRPSHLRLGFIGKINYPPNRDGIEWFGGSIWPLILKEVPEARFRIMGINQNNRANLDFPNFEPLGFVEDAREEMVTWNAMVVPLRFGGGTRLKILEAFSRMCPVISTTIGAYGHSVFNGHELFLADSPEEFARACIKLLKQPELGEQPAGLGWQYFKQKGTWESISPAVHNAVAGCLKH